MAKPRDMDSYVKMYKASYKDKLDQLREEFGEKVVGVATRNYLVGIAIIVDEYRLWKSAVECLKAIPFIRYYIFEASEEELNSISKDINYAFECRCIREFIFKDQKGILDSFKRRCPPPEDLERYMEVFSGMARECVEFCLEKFRGEIDTIREMEKEEAFEEMIERGLRAAEENKDNLKSAAEIRRGERKIFVERLQGERGERREGSGVSISDDENIDVVNGSRVKWSV
jgi:hypothetical protein